MVENQRKHGTPLLYERTDIAGVLQQFKAVDYHEEFIINQPGLLKTKKDKVSFEFFDAGHIFGSAFVKILAEGKTIVFSGDIGNVDVPILKDTENLPDKVDLLVCESTYGDRIHESAQGRDEMIEEVVSTAIVSRGGVLMIPSFSLERTQELMYVLHKLIEIKHRLPKVPIFLDSPLAIGATRVYRKFTNYYDEEATELLRGGEDLFDFPGLELCETKEESKRINSVPGPKIIIAGSGMMNGGRIIHHAIRYLPDDRNTLLIIGYQAEGTLGRRILIGQSPVDIMGERIPVHCHVKALGALSAHGDQKKLMSWINSGKNLPGRVYLNHGEPTASQVLADHLITDLKVEAFLAKEQEPLIF